MDNVTRLPTGPRPIGAIVQNVVSAAAKAKAERDALIRAHEYAARFHQAMHDALSAQNEIERYADEMRREIERFGGARDSFWADERATAEKDYQDAVGRAAGAMTAMPDKWATVLQIAVPPLPPAA